MELIYIDSVWKVRFMPSVQKVNFTGSPITAAASVVRNFGEAERIALKSDLAKEVQEFLPKKVRLFNKIADKISGEIPNIIITALGTALIAPIFIKWNPLSKTDEETRTYSALRQPISAVLAVITQVGISKPIENVITRLCNTGFFSNEIFCKTALQDEAFLTKMFTKANPTMSEGKVKKLVADKIAQQRLDLINSIKDKNTIEYLKDGKVSPMSKESFEELINSTLDDLIKVENKNITRVKEEKPAFKKARGEYYRTHADEARNHFDEIKNFAHKTTDKKELEEFFVKKIKTLKKAKAHPELIKIVSDLKCWNSGNGLNGKIAEMKLACASYEGLGSYSEVEAKVAKSIAEKVEVLESKVKILDEAKKAFKNKESIPAIEKIISKIVDAKDPSKKEIRFIEKIVDKYTSNINGNIKGLRNLSSVCLSLAILPLTAWLLNKIYPWFMDTVFPDLSKTKHSKEKQKLIDKAKGVQK